MGTFEDIRKAFQDLLAPELRAIAARQEAAEHVATARYNEVTARAESRHNEMLARFEVVDEKFERILATFAIDKRLGRLEEQRDKLAS